MISGNDYRASLRRRPGGLARRQASERCERASAAAKVRRLDREQLRRVRSARSIRCTASPGRGTSSASRCTCWCRAIAPRPRRLGAWRSPRLPISCSAASTAYGPRLERFAAECRDRDRRVAAAIDDTARPVQIVERRADGIVIAGGKQHVVGAPVVHELLLVPSGRGGDDAARRVRSAREQRRECGSSRRRPHLGRKTTGTTP